MPNVTKQGNKIPLELEVALGFKLLTPSKLFSLLTLFALFTVFTLLTLFKQWHVYLYILSYGIRLYCFTRFMTLLAV